MIDRLSKGWLVSISALLATTPPAIVLWFQDQLSSYLSKLPPEVTPRVIASLLLTTTALAVYTYLLRREKKYLFYPELGLKGDAKTGLFFCPKCEKPMRIENDHLFCIPCQTKVTPPNKQAAEMVWRITGQKRVHL